MCHYTIQLKHFTSWVLVPRYPPSPPGEECVQLEANNSETSTTADEAPLPTSPKEWKTYSDAALGIEFQYPSDWEIKEKTNRFEKGPELSIEETDGVNSFSVSTADDISGDIFDAEFFATMGQNELTGKADTRLIEGVKEHTAVGGEEAFSFTYTLESEFGLEAVQEPIALIHDDKGYIFAFTGLTTSFDDPENVEIRERMLDSISFLDGSGGGTINEDEGDDENNEE